MACGRGSPELPKSYMDMASKLFTFTFTFTPLLACLVLCPCVDAPPTDRVRFCPGTFACAWSCFARVRRCAQGYCGRCPAGSGVMSDLSYFIVVVFLETGTPSEDSAMSA